jgi:hypothetical protein
VIAVAALFVFALADTTVVLGQLERDLTGDGKPEVLRVVGVGRSVDSLEVTFTIASGASGADTIYRARLAPLTRTVGYDAGRRLLSATEHRDRLAEFGRWFFEPRKFTSPAAFVDELRAMAPGRVVEIPEVIERDRSRSDARSGADIWTELSRAPITVFMFSPGGDTLFAIGWSPMGSRFYRLLECC